MDCPNCGYSLPDGTHKCTACNTVLVQGPKSRQSNPRYSLYQTEDKEAAARLKAAVAAAVKEAAEKEAAALAAAEREKAAHEAAAKAAKEAAAKAKAAKVAAEIKKAAKEAAEKQRAAKEAAAMAKAAKEAAAREKEAKEAAEKAAKETAAKEKAAKEAAERETAERAAQQAAKEAAEKAAAEQAAKEAAEKAAAEQAAKEAAEKAAAEQAAKEAAEKAAAEQAAKEAAEKAAAEQAAKQAAEKAAAEQTAKQAADKTAAEQAAKEAAEKAAAEQAAKQAAEKAAAEQTAKQAADKAAAPAPGPAATEPPRLSYKLVGANMPAVSVTLDEGQSICTPARGAMWTSGGVSMQTQEGSPFAAVYTSSEYGQEVGIASRFPGTIVDLHLNGTAVIVQESALLAAQPAAQLAPHLSMQTPGSRAIAFSRLSGKGLAFLAIHGSLIERVLTAGEALKADTGSIAAFEAGVSHQTEIVSGVSGSGGGSLLLSTLTGPGKVWMQTMAQGE